MTPTARLFVAVWPPPEVVSLLASLPRPHVDGLRWTTPEQWHVTLRFLGSCVLDEVVPQFRSAPVGGVGGLGAVEAVLGPATGRFGRRVLHVPVAGVEELAAAMAAAGLPSPEADRPFAGHLTLARARGRGGADLRGLVGVPLAARWQVGEVTLVQSHLGRGPARYEVVDRVVLPG